MPSDRSPFSWVQTALSQLGVRRVLFDRRAEPRETASGQLAITWRDEASRAQHARVEMVNLSEHGVAFVGRIQLGIGHIIGIRRGDGICRAVVRHCRPAEAKFVTGVELCETYRVPVAASLDLR